MENCGAGGLEYGLEQLENDTCSGAGDLAEAVVECVQDPELELVNNNAGEQR